MANHQPEADNYVEKKTWDEAMADVPASKSADREKAKADDAAKRAKDKGEAAHNGGGDK